MEKKLFVEMTSAEMRSVNGGSSLEKIWKIVKKILKDLDSDGSPQV